MVGGVGSCRPTPRLCDDEVAHAAGVGDDRVILACVGSVDEQGGEPLGPQVDAAMDPVPGNIGSLAGGQFDDPAVAGDRLQQQGTVTGEAGVGLGATGFDVQVATCDGELVSYPARLSRSSNAAVSW